MENLNKYTFVIRISGCVLSRCEQEILEAQQAILYLTKLGARFVVVAHNNNVSTTKKISSIFGFAVTSTANIYITENTQDGILTVLQKIRRSGQPIHTGRQLIYIDNYTPYIQIAVTQGYTAYNVTRINLTSIVAISNILIKL